MSTRTLWRAAAFALTCAVAAGCAEELPPIDRVQPDYFDKAFFIGEDFKDDSDNPEFYSQGTLVDVGYGASQDGLFTSTYAQPLTRVRWSVTEDLLIARLAYERIVGSDGKGAGQATNDGVIVAAYPITKHFDIQRTYNPSTGEQYNVVEENTVDRPWNERQFMRVNWSMNLSTDNYDFDTLSLLGVYGGVTYEPLHYYVNDPAHEDAPHFDLEEGYLDITNKAFASPQMVDISHFGWGLGEIPACWFDADFMNGTAPAASCSPVELTIRQSFRRVEEDDYEPAHWDGYRFQAFGAFVTERSGYARNYGMTDTQWHRFINRYDIWERSHFYENPNRMSGPVECFTPDTTPAGGDPHRDLDGNGTEDECEAVGPGSRCDEFTQKCTLPYMERKEKTVVWYYANGSNPDYFQPTREAAHEWDVALRGAVMTARYAECRKVGGEDCETRFPVYHGQMDENEDAVRLAWEVDLCRSGDAYGTRRCDEVAEEVAEARGYSDAVLKLALMKEMIVLCHSPVEADDNILCAPNDQRLPPELTAANCHAARKAGGPEDVLATCARALNVRRGDLRYHQVNVIENPQTPSPWGIMVDSNDPLTGQTVAASINVWSHVNDLFAQGIVDTARYIKGELATEDITEGTYIKDWATAARAATQNGAVPPVTRSALSQRIRAFAVESLPEPQREGALEALEGQKLSLENVALKEKLHRLSVELSSIRADAYAPSLSQPIYDARRKRAIGSQTEALLTTPMMQAFAGVAGLPSSELVTRFASPLQGANPGVIRDYMRRRELAYAEQGACVMHEAPAPFAIADLADLLEEKFGDFDPSEDKATQLERAAKMQRYLAQRAHYAVVTHEMGHSIGLRHNFVSSSDAWNYRPQYWQLRTDNATNLAPCVDLTPDGSCTGPRYFDPVTDAERENLIHMFQQSSTMDYAGEATQDLMGLGAYDFAAARMFYGDVAAVLKDPSFVTGTPRAVGVLEKLDNFGGIVGFKPTIGTNGFPEPTSTVDIHYSELQANYGLIHDCKDVDPARFKPADWDEELLGEWHPLLDGKLVNVGGTYSRCKQQPVDYVSWETLRAPTATEAAFPRTDHAIDEAGRVRFPYGFATDRWADLGNLSVYRHDNGADPYELFEFLITQQEVNHIFDNYRRNRRSFTVRGASGRSLHRYNTKLRDGAKGLGLIANIYRDFANAQGYDYQGLWPYITNAFYADNILASGIAFDHFARQLARPEAGPHFMAPLSNLENGPQILRSTVDPEGNAGDAVAIIPNGATGYFRNVGIGGRPLENNLADDKGEYDSEFTVNAGSYYDKAWTAMLMTESVDNFISDSRRDFLDSRYRAVSMADLFPDGFRRWLGNNLTGDESLKGPRLQLGTNGLPAVDAQLFPQTGLGYIQWWSPSPEVCFPGDESLLCQTTAQGTVPVDSQVGWEQQKFLIAFTLLYLPENQQQHWLNMMNIWELGADTDPGFPDRIELHLPGGRTFLARTFGKETLLGKTVHKGIAARMLAYANKLLAAAYETTPGPDLDGDAQPDWVVPTLASDGQFRVKFDPAIQYIDENGFIVSNPVCNASDNSGCTCSANRACIELGKFEELPFFMRQAMKDYGLADPSMKGLY